MLLRPIHCHVPFTVFYSTPCCAGSIHVKYTSIAWPMPGKQRKMVASHRFNIWMFGHECQIPWLGCALPLSFISRSLNNVYLRMPFPIPDPECFKIFRVFTHLMARVRIFSILSSKAPVLSYKALISIPSPGIFRNQHGLINIFKKVKMVILTVRT